MLLMTFVQALVIAQTSYPVPNPRQLAWQQAEMGVVFHYDLHVFDGNKYALQALNKGANYAIIDEKEYLLDDRMILVDDALKCLQELARYHRQQLNIPILALTGSNGKTTTKELINSVLQKKYNCYATKGNLNNHIGVPLTLLNMTPEHNFGVVEMGANHLNEIETLCNIALPDYGYITNFGRVHLEGFGSFEGVIRGKTEMYRHLKNRD